MKHEFRISESGRCTVCNSIDVVALAYVTHWRWFVFRRKFDIVACREKGCPGVWLSPTLSPLTPPTRRVNVLLPGHREVFEGLNADDVGALAAAASMEKKLGHNGADATSRAVIDSEDVRYIYRY